MRCNVSDNIVSILNFLITSLLRVSTFAIEFPTIVTVIYFFVYMRVVCVRTHTSIFVIRITTKYFEMYIHYYFYLENPFKHVRKTFNSVPLRMVEPRFYTS